MLRRLFSALTLTVALTSTSACTVFLDSEATQCSTDADCLGRGDAFRGNTCEPTRKVCVRSTSYCETNAQCIAANGSKTWACNKATNGCYNLTSTDCPRVLGVDHVENENSIILGFPWMASTAGQLKPAESAMEIARQELEAAGHLPGVQPGAPPRPLVWVVCDSNELDFEPSLKRGMDHILSLGVPLSTGGLFPDIAAYQVNKFAPAGIFMWGFVAISPAFENAPGRKGLFFTDTGEPKPYWDTIAKLAEVHEQAYRTAGVTRPLKLAIGIPTDPVIVRDIVKFLPLFSINGKSAADAKAAGELIELGLGPENEAGTTYAAALAKLDVEKPDIIATLGQKTGDLLYRYEKKYPGQARFVVTEAAVGLDYTALFTPGEDATRVLGIMPSPPTDDPEVLAYNQIQQLKFPDDEVSQAAFGMYNVGILTALTIAAVGDQPVTGANIGKALLTRFKADLPDRIPVDAAVAYGEAFQKLGQGQNINYNNTEFDEEGLLKVFRVDIFCADPSKTSTPKVRPAGAHYDARLGKLNTAPKCLF